MNTKSLTEKIREEVIKRSDEFERQTLGTKDEYNIYREHIQYVYNWVVYLAKDKDVDLEILELSALLHDIAMTDKNLNRSRHNEYGAEIAEKLLLENNYPSDKTDFVKKIILNHSSKRKSFRTTLEEEILVTADGLSHFDSIKNLYSLAHNVMELDETESVKFIQEKLTKDYDEISDDMKPLIDDKYKQVMSVATLSELESIIIISKENA